MSTHTLSFFKISSLILAFVFLTVALPVVKAQDPCKPDLASCPDEGCSSDNHHDPLLNKLKERQDAGQQHSAGRFG